MATSFPTSVDALTNPTSGNALTSPSHADQHTNANDAIEAIETQLGAEAFTTHVPTVGNGGTVTWTTITGWYRKIGKMVFVNFYLVVNAAGSGSGVVSISTPSTPGRTVAQVLTGNHASSGTAHGTIALVTLVGDTGATWTRLRKSSGANILGSDLASGDIITIQGWYREA